MKRVFINIERCTGCKSCEIACAVQHSKTKDLFTAIFEDPPPQKRTHVLKALEFSYPSRCMHCIDAPCMKACPRSAMFWDSELERVSINKDRCIGCFMCAMVCPFGAISVRRPERIALKCDLCGSRLREGRIPACVESCPTKALLFGEVEELSKKKGLDMAEKIAYSRKEEPERINPLKILRQMGGF
mgnify:CR=1 FL=1